MSALRCPGRVRAPLALAGHSDAFEYGEHLWCVAPLAGSDQQRERSATTFTGEVDLARETAPGPSESLVGAVLPGRGSFFGIRGFFLRAPTACWWARQDVESTPCVCPEVGVHGSPQAHQGILVPPLFLRVDVAVPQGVFGHLAPNLAKPTEDDLGGIRHRGRGCGSSFGSGARNTGRNSRVRQRRDPAPEEPCRGPPSPSSSPPQPDCRRRLPCCPSRRDGERVTESIAGWIWDRNLRAFLELLSGCAGYAFEVAP